MAEKLIDRDEDIMQASMAIKAIAHPLRLKVLCVLAGNELSVQEIVDYVGTSQSNISQHLAILREKAYWQPARMPTGCFIVLVTRVHLNW